MPLVDYDVIVIGAGIGGLTTASLLAKRGFKVIVLEQNDHPGGYCGTLSQDGYIFDMGASLFWGFDEGGCFYSLFSELGIMDRMLKGDRIRRLDPGFQTVLPNHRIDLFSDRNRFFEEIKREFPKDLMNLKDFYNEIDHIEEKLYEIGGTKHPFVYNGKNGVKINQTKKILLNIYILLNKNRYLEGYMRGWDERLELEKFIDLQTMYFGQRGAGDSTLPFLAIISGIPRRGIYYIKGGAHFIADELESSIRESKGELIYHARVEEILTRKKGDVCGVKVRHRDMPLEIFSRTVISDIPIFNLLKRDISRIRYKRMMKYLQQGWVPFSILLGVDEKVIPEPMREHVLMMRDYNLPSYGDNLIFISVNPVWDKTRAPEGKRCITASIFLPSDIIQCNNKGVLREKGEEIILYLEDVIPFLSDYIECVIYLDPLTYQRVTMREDGKMGMIKGGIDMYGFSGLSNISPSRDLFLVGDTTYPGHSTAATVKSGIRTADLITKRI
ncbi:MAG: NAD(P)/FAD-dependent oxidoreductase [Nitrospinae bacterium]|nr:NAD(P)/FAD-dependent oxidoreductase [Nitrospinota bacterium]